VDDRIFGRRYRVTEHIGSGGMADVFKAKDEVLGRTVAVKVLDRKYASETDFVARFRQEAQAAASLSHHNIVNIYDWGRDEDDYFIVMEYVRGTDLKSLITKHGAVDPDDATEWAIQICSALSAAHGYGIIHRDVKPHNIVLMPDGTIKVMDFGIARAGDSSMTQTGSVLGTAQYISPEQAQGRQLGPSADLYSLGIVLYELTTGRLPFEGDSPITVALKQVNEDPTPPRELDSSIPPALESVIMRALQKDPMLRYGSAEEMRVDLKRVLAGQQVSIPHVPAPDETSVMPVVEATPHVAKTPHRPVAEAPRRKPWIWILVILALTLTGLGVAWAVGAFSTPMITVPSVIGMQADDASDTLTRTGLVTSPLEYENNDSVGEGRVIRQDPEAGASVEESSSVILVVSTGVEMFEVPELIGLTESEAISAIREAGLSLETIQREYSAETEEGLVMRQVPDGLTSVPKNTNVTIIVSNGTELVKVPEVTGLTKEEAVSEIEIAGFVANITEEFNDDIAEGIVISQSPSPGVSIETGSPISIVVSKGLDLVAVPNVVDADEAGAVAAIVAAGLVADVEYVDSPDDGIVLSQWPIAGADAERGSVVALTVGKTPPDPDPPGP